MGYNFRYRTQQAPVLLLKHQINIGLIIKDWQWLSKLVRKRELPTGIVTHKRRLLSRKNSLFIDFTSSLLIFFTLITPVLMPYNRHHVCLLMNQSASLTARFCFETQWCHLKLFAVNVVVACWKERKLNEFRFRRLLFLYFEIFLDISLVL